MSKNTAFQWPSPPSDFSETHRAEFATNLGKGRVGRQLVSETDRVRVWALSLKPGERIGFHTHVLDYFWTVVTGGRARSQYADGRVAEVSYAPGDTRHYRFGAGEFMIHDLHNIGDTELTFTTVEFVDGANAPLPIA